MKGLNMPASSSHFSLSNQFCKALGVHAKKMHWVGIAANMDVSLYDLGIERRRIPDVLDLINRKCGADLYSYEEMKYDKVEQLVPWARLGMREMLVSIIFQDVEQRYYLLQQP